MGTNDFMEQNLFVTCPNDNKLQSVDLCFRCDQSVQISFKRNKVECVDKGGFNHRNIWMMAQEEVQ